MSSAVDIQIASTPNLQKIENFFKNASYRETIEFSANFNTRLCLERRLRLPFFDPQTRIAQNHSQLFMDKRLRMPGFRQGQIYTYPAARWRKSRRQYLNRMYRFPDRPFQGFRKEQETLTGTAPSSSTLVSTASPTVTATTDTDFNGGLLEESSSLGAAGGDTSDSKDSQQQQYQQQVQQQPQQQQTPQTHQQPTQKAHLKDDLVKEWFFDDIDMHDVDSLEDPKSPADDEYDYDPRYGNKKRRKRRAGRRSLLTPGEGGLISSSGSGSGRRRSGAGRGRSSISIATTPASATNALTNLANASVSGDTTDAATGNTAANSDVTTTPTTSGGGRRQRGTGTRGRRRSKKADGSSTCHPPSPGLAMEPPSFESAAAAVGVVSGELPLPDEHDDLRNYRKYL